MTSPDRNGNHSTGNGESRADIGALFDEISAQDDLMVVPPEPARKSSGKPGQLIGCPPAFMAEVCRLTEGRTALVVALCIYKRTIVESSRTVTLPTGELAVYGVTRQRKAEALAKLEAARLVAVEAANGRTARITLLWTTQTVRWGGR